MNTYLVRGAICLHVLVADIAEAVSGKKEKEELEKNLQITLITL
jgi:hypothetical protein